MLAATGFRCRTVPTSRKTNGPDSEDTHLMLEVRFQRSEGVQLLTTRSGNSVRRRM